MSIIIIKNSHKGSRLKNQDFSEAENDNIIPNVILDNKVDGIIVLGQMKSKYLENIKNTEVPLVFLDFYKEMMDVDSIISDSFYGAFTITNHLISKGHRDIGFIGNIYATNSILDRYLGYQKALLINKIPLRDQWLIFSSISLRRWDTRCQKTYLL